MKNFAYSLKNLLVPVLLTFCTIMSVSYYKNNYKTVATELSLNKIGIGQASASENVVKFVPKKVVYNDQIKFVQKNNPLGKTMLRQTKKISYSQKIFMEEVK